jgi:CRP-like cAMP-binding protein
LAIIGSNLVPSPELKTGLEQLATVVSKPRGTILFRRGDNAFGVFLIRSGRVSLALDCPSPLYPPRILGPGAIVGLPATVSGNAYSLTATLLDDSELAFVARDAVLECLQDNPLLCFQVMDMLSDEISDIRSAFKQNGSNRRSKG